MARRIHLIVQAGLLAAAAPPALAGRTRVAAAAKDNTDDEAAKAFLAFGKGPEARAIVEKYGYSLE
jgi:ABC-type molybdate transport system substrate-binding protein